MHAERPALLELATVLEFHTVHEPNTRLRLALDRAWAVLGPQAFEQARLRRGCAFCGRPLEQAGDDLCGRCAAEIPALPATIEGVPRG